MEYRKQKKKMDTKRILNEVNKCKPEELENLLKRIETEIEKSDGKDEDYLLAKTMTTSRLASVKNQKCKMII